MLAACLFSLILAAVLAVFLLCSCRNRKKDRDTFSEKEADFQRQLAIQSVSVRDLFFSRLVLGEYYKNLEDLEADGKQVSVEFPNHTFVLLIARLETWGELFQDNRADRREINFILRNVLENSFPGVTCAADVKGSTTAVINLPAVPETGLRGIVQDARHALEVLDSEFGLTVTMALSRVYQSPLDLSRAYDDACRVLEFRQLLEDDAVITTYEELSYTHMAAAGTSYLDLEQQLLQCVRHSDFEKMRKLLHEMIDLGFGTSAATVETVRFRVYGAVNLLLYLADDLRSVVGNETIERIDPGPRLTSARSLSEIVAVIDDIFDALEEQASSAQRASLSAWVDEIPGYIEEHYRDPDMNVTSIADHFQLSATYCSKLYKERYHRFLHDAIQIRRLKSAKDLLPTAMSLNQIAEECGFSSALTMSRAFKKFEGISPGQYRTAKS